MATLNMSDLDLLVETEAEAEEAPPPRRSSRLIIWLIMVGVGILFIPLYLVNATIQEAVAPMQTELESIQATLAVTPSVAPEEETLNQTLLDVREQMVSLEAISPTITTGHIDWPTVMAVLSRYDPEQLTLTGITQTGFRATVTGEAADEMMVIQYTRTLQDSGEFGRVNVQTISVKSEEPVPTAIPIATLAPEATVDPMFTPAPTLVPFPTMSVEFTLSVELKASNNEQSE